MLSQTVSVLDPLNEGVLLATYEVFPMFATCASGRIDGTVRSGSYSLTSYQHANNLFFVEFTLPLPQTEEKVRHWGWNMDTGLASSYQLAKLFVDIQAHGQSYLQISERLHSYHQEIMIGTRWVYDDLVEAERIANRLDAGWSDNSPTPEQVNDLNSLTSLLNFAVRDCIFQRDNAVNTGTTMTQFLSASMALNRRTNDTYTAIPKDETQQRQVELAEQLAARQVQPAQLRQEYRAAIAGLLRNSIPTLRMLIIGSIYATRALILRRDINRINDQIDQITQELEKLARTSATLAQLRDTLGGLGDSLEDVDKSIQDAQLGWNSMIVYLETAINQLTQAINAEQMNEVTRTIRRARSAWSSAAFISNSMTGVIQDGRSLFLHYLRLGKRRVPTEEIPLTLNSVESAELPMG